MPGMRAAERDGRCGDGRVGGLQQLAADIARDVLALDAQIGQQPVIEMGEPLDAALHGPPVLELRCEVVQHFGLLHWCKTPLSSVHPGG